MLIFGLRRFVLNNPNTFLCNRDTDGHMNQVGGRTSGKSCMYVYMHTHMLACMNTVTNYPFHYDWPPGFLMVKMQNRIANQADVKAFSIQTLLIGRVLPLFLCIYNRVQLGHASGWNVRTELLHCAQMSVSYMDLRLSSHTFLLYSFIHSFKNL